MPYTPKLKKNGLAISVRHGLQITFCPKPAVSTFQKVENKHDTEGWNMRLNVHCDHQHDGKALPLYMLIGAKEAQLVELFEEISLQHHTLRVKRKIYVL